jgi:hypothetical protein
MIETAVLALFVVAMITLAAGLFGLKAETAGVAVNSRSGIEQRRN